MDVSRESSRNGEVPRVLLVFTCWVCTGIMANFTVVVPLTVYYAGKFFSSAAVVSSYALGALISLTFWSQYHSRAIRPAYLTHATVMVIGNVLFGIASTFSRAWTLHYLARFIVGLEGGCMYNANLALVSFSFKTNRVKYLSYYQSFVGLGLVLGPGVSATSLVIANAMGRPGLRTVIIGALMSAWGLVLLITLLVAMPYDEDLRAAAGSPTSSTADSHDSKASPLSEEAEDDDDEDDAGALSPSQRATRRRTFWFYSCAGNFWRIFQRLAWEVGAVLILARYFHWGAIAAGYSLSSFGFAQTIAQYLYGNIRARNATTSSLETIKETSVCDLKALELVELAGILAMFSKTAATHDWLVAFNVTFILGSLVFYVASCLTSAPFNDLVLWGAGSSMRYEDVLLASQYGIFLAFFFAPFAARGAILLDTTSPSTIAGVLVIGWAGQTLVNTALSKRIDSRLVAALALGLSGLVAWSMFDHAAGGTGWPNVFSYHPIFMAWSFYGCMTPGQLVYRDDATIFRFFQGKAKSDLRKSHAAWMALATLFAFVGYWCIFAAHEQSGESQLGMGESWSRALHVALGYPVLLWFAVQTTSGVFKERNLAASGVKTFPWHGLSGKYLLLAGYVVASLGFWLRMNYSKQGGWSLPYKFLLTGIALALFGFRAFPDSSLKASSDERPPPDVDHAAAGVL
ncbi:hypothetical protein CTAYLR_000492 [Chrysophaeum taylorii]|uniref:Cytochrome b561 domain-containing protein n=1 Tax=Chrysophaeum taylorii TaxID=2483200 RepID=A0AAD7UG66_9STRA|nr:hypothetical protein CTAYLR_000492 [Chrysophaeum taylorii]